MMIGYAPVLFVILALCELIVFNQFVGSGKQVRSIDIAIDELRAENEVLEQKVASASSLMTISSKAREQGFIEPSKNQFITLVPDQLPVAINK